MIQILLFLAAAVICVPLAARLGLGSVLGYLMAGVLIGPWGFGLVSNIETILHASELGVVLMLFMIGLELEPKRLWAMRLAVFGGGALQMLVCAALLMPIGLLAGWTWQASLVSALAMSLSSTAIAVQIMQERNLLSSPPGRSGFAILLFQDIAAIPLLALAAALGPQTSGEANLLQIAKQLAAIVGVVVIGRFLAYPAMRVIASLGLREVFTAFALLLVMGIAALMDYVALSMGLGAFLAGVLLAGSEYRHALEADIQPFKGLLLGLFFIAVGMTMNLGLVAQAPLTVGAGLLLIVALKLAGLWWLGRRLDVPGDQRGLFAVLLSQVGEFAFVVISTAREAQVLPQTEAGLLTIIAALSMATTPLLLIVRERLAKSRVTEREADSMENAYAPVLIAGFGRYGQIVGRLLLASGIRPTILDHDANTIDTLRKFGYKLYYGDATRLDLIEAAGIAHAKVLVVAIDDPEQSLKLVDLVQQHFPHVKLVARARDVVHALQLKTRNVELIERELFESSLRSGRSVLELLGFDPWRAREFADTFRRINERLVNELVEHRDNESGRIALVRTAQQRLQEQLEQDQIRFDKDHRSGEW